METGREREREQGWRLVDEHKKGTGMGAGTEMRAVTELGTGTGTRTESGRVEKSLRRAINRTRVVDAMLETGETFLVEIKNMWTRKDSFSSCRPR